MSCKCGDNCSCGDDCKCGRNPSLSYSESETTETIIAGVAPVKMFNERSEMSYGGEGGGCKCGGSCKCDPCTC